MTYFAKCGHEVHLITDEHVEYEGVVTHSLNLEVKKSPSYFLKKLFKIKRLLKKIKPDILHSHTITTEGYIGALTGFHPFVVTIWGVDIYVRPHKSIDELLFTKLVLKRADLVTADSQDQIDAAVNLGGKPEKSTVIQWGVDLDVFKPTDATEARKELGFGDAPVVLSPRKFLPLYNIDVVVRSFREVLKTFPDARMLITGSGLCEEDIKALIHQLALTEHIHFTGYIPYNDLPRYLAAADVSVSVPSTDGTAMAVLEAMACGIPLIVSDLPSNHEWIEDGRNGFVVPVRDEDALTRRLLDVLQNRAIYRNRFNEPNQRLVQEQGSRETNMRRMESLYQQLIEQKHRR